MKKENWPILLDQYLTESKTKTFEWGKFDCCIFATDWILLATDIDYFEPYRGKYDSMKSAYKLIGRNLDTLVSEKLRGLPIAFAQRGDVVACQTELGIALGVFDGTDGWFTSEEGLITKPICLAWRII